MGFELYDRNYFRMMRWKTGCTMPLTLVGWHSAVRYVAEIIVIRL
ncbi:hypothetical protein Desor_3707 [Desulfosporosinus orientis DSM 765]|uniref:Uncharacterized protein n=1 Tax=Desulfosporosinus orientis (strain ATCC 19365 / DSM 765 / NCIMB 8382 / VKM B-1628 / Singapore I) TaxID=768706 RepID=G7W6P3_DESOD|nr:hypothetical protein Desor_3707 [Desulfosporosinus orientis DSM 765]